MNEQCKACGATYQPLDGAIDLDLCAMCWFERHQKQQEAREAFGQQEMDAISNTIREDAGFTALIIGSTILRLIGLLLSRWTIHLTLFSACVDFYFLVSQYKLRKVVPLMLFSETTRMQMARVVFSVYAAFDWRVGLAFAALEIFGMLISFTVAMHDKDVR